MLDLRRLRRAGRRGAAGARQLQTRRPVDDRSQMDRRAVDRRGRRRTPRVLGQLVHADVRHVPAPCGRLGRRHRRIRGRDGRLPDESWRRPAAGHDRQLHRHVRHRGVGISHRLVDHPLARAATEAGGNRYLG